MHSHLDIAKHGRTITRGGRGRGGVPPGLNTITVQCTPYIIIVLRANKSRAYENL